MDSKQLGIELRKRFQDKCDMRTSVYEDAFRRVEMSGSVEQMYLLLEDIEQWHAVRKCAGDDRAFLDKAKRWVRDNEIGATIPLVVNIAACSDYACNGLYMAADMLGELMNEPSTQAMFAQAEYMAKRLDMSVIGVLRMAVYGEIERQRITSQPFGERWPDDWTKPEEM